MDAKKAIEFLQGENEIHLPVPIAKQIADLIQHQAERIEKRWIPVSERLPEQPKKHEEPIPVLCTDGRQVFRACYVGEKVINCEDLGYDGEADYDETTDNYYWLEGWYEWNDCEETHWALGWKITHWMPLPDSPEGL